MRERPAQVVLPAAQEPLHQSLGGIVEYASSFRLLSGENLLTYCAAALHLSCLLICFSKSIKSSAPGLVGQLLAARWDKSDAL